MSETADLVIAGGTVVNAHGRERAHVVIRDGHIVQLIDAKRPTPAGRQIIDAHDQLVIPGGVDGHCHVAQITGPYRTLDDFAVTSEAALWGGTTTIMDFGIPRDTHESPLAAARNKLDLARDARCDVALHGSVLTWDGTTAAQLDQLARMGICSVKMYTTNRGTTIADGDTILKVLHELKRLDGLAYIHAEHDAMIVDCTDQHAADGHTGIQHLHHTRPGLAEEASVREVLDMAEYTGAAVYFVHQTTPIAVDLVTQARDRGITAYSETCPHYLTLDDSVYAGDFPEWFSCCPPMRDRKTVQALRTRLAQGGIHTVSSDHSCFDRSQKREHLDDIRLMPHGLPGIETRMPVTYTAMVVEQGLPVEQFVDVFATQPAQINRIPRKGAIAPGFDADLVILDPDTSRVVDGRALHMGTDFSPFNGRELWGWPDIVISQGRVVVADGRFHDPGPVGRFIARYAPGHTQVAAIPATRTA